VQELGRGPGLSRWSRQGHTPTRAELADARTCRTEELAGVPPPTNFSPLSLGSVAATDAPLSEQLGAESAELEGMADLLTLRRELRCLTAREQRVIQWRFADGLTQSEIAERLGVSQMQVSRILSSIVARLREAFDPEPLVS
jgi:RNA polymerase sigma-B factor